jgi:hypothetical protein
VSASALCRAGLRVGERLEPTQTSLERAVAASPIVHPDETGWRCGGHRRWLWTFVAADVTVYRIAASRGGDPTAGGMVAGLPVGCGPPGCGLQRELTLLALVLLGLVS